MGSKLQYCTGSMEHLHSNKEVHRAVNEGAARKIEHVGQQMLDMGRSLTRYRVEVRIAEAF